MPLEPVDLGPVLDSVRKDLEVEIRDSRAKVDISQVSGSVMANQSSLHLVLANLLTNAIKFVARGQIPEIRCWTEAPQPVADQSPVLRLWVQDRGIGISEKHCHKVFGVFQRLHTREQYPGTGIGLAIVKRAVERMGGRVGFDSVEGQGSRFWVELAKA